MLLQAKRDPDEEGDYMAFEQLMAEAAAKKGKEDKKDAKKPKMEAKTEEAKKEETSLPHRHGFHSRHQGSDKGAQAPL